MSETTPALAQTCCQATQAQTDAEKLINGLLEETNLAQVGEDLHELFMLLLIDVADEKSDLYDHMVKSYITLHDHLLLVGKFAQKHGIYCKCERGAK